MIFYQTPNTSCMIKLRNNYKKKHFFSPVDIMLALTLVTLKLFKTNSHNIICLNYFTKLEIHHV